MHNQTISERRIEGREKAIEGILLGRLGDSDPQVANSVIKALGQDENRGKKNGRIPFVRRARIPLSLAAGILIMIGVGFIISLGRPEKAIGRVQNIVGTVRYKVSGDESARLLGQDDAILRQTLITTSEGATLTWIYSSDATEVTLKSGTMCKVTEQPRQLRLDGGLLTASVARQKGRNRFSVRTPHATIEVKGTELALSVSAVGTILKVSEGAVAMTAADGRSTLTVFAGELGEARPGQPIRKRSLSEVHFFPLDESIASAGPELPTDGLFSWAKEYYVTKQDWFLNAYSFSDGNIFAVVTPEDLIKVKGSGNAKTRIVNAKGPNGKSSSCFEVDNHESRYHRIVFNVGEDLSEFPEAFAIEINIQGLKVRKSGKEIEPGGPFLYGGHIPAADDAPCRDYLPLEQTVKGISRTSNKLKEWVCYRVEYFKVGHSSDGEIMYEVRQPHGKNSFAFSIGLKEQDAFFVAVKSMRMRFGEIRLRRLVPPPSVQSLMEADNKNERNR